MLDDDVIAKNIVVSGDGDHARLTGKDLGAFWCRKVNALVLVLPPGDGTHPLAIVGGEDTVVQGHPQVRVQEKGAFRGGDALRGVVLERLPVNDVYISSIGIVKPFLYQGGKGILGIQGNEQAGGIGNNEGLSFQLIVGGQVVQKGNLLIGNGEPCR